MENVNPIFLYLIAVFKFGVSAFLAMLIIGTPFFLLYKMFTFFLGPLDKNKWFGTKFSENFTFTALVTILMGPLGLIAAMMDDNHENKRAAILGALTTNLIYAALIAYGIMSDV